MPPRLAFHPSGRFLAATSNDATVKLYDTATWKRAQSFDWNIGRLRSVAFSPDGMLAAGRGARGKIVVWDVDLQANREYGRLAARRPSPYPGVRACLQVWAKVMAGPLAGSAWEIVDPFNLVYLGWLGLPLIVAYPSRPCWATACLAAMGFSLWFLSGVLSVMVAVWGA